MRYRVVVTDAAEADIDDIVDHIAMTDSLEKAVAVFEALRALAHDLATLPERGRVPPELASLGNTEYRERFFKPYRLVYSIDDRDVRILLVADGRGNMQRLLIRRLLGQ